MENLDTLLAAASPGSTISLDTTKVYSTVGHIIAASNQPVLKQGCKLLGNGATIKLVPSSPTSQINILTGEGDNVVQEIAVEGDTVSPGSHYKRNGIWIDGENNTIYSCIVRKQYGSYADSYESFGIVAHGKNSKIDLCQVRDVQGDYISAIALLTSSVVTNCEVALPNATGAEFYVAYNIQSDIGSSVTDCVSVGGSAGVYTDYLNTLNARVKNCIFTDCVYGIHINCDENDPQDVYRAVHNFQMYNCEINLLANPAVTFPVGVLMTHIWNPYSSNPITNPRKRATNIHFKRCSINLNLPVGQTYTGPTAYAANIATKASACDATKGIHNVLFEDVTVDSRITHWRNENHRASNVVIAKSNTSVDWLNVNGFDIRENISEPNANYRKVVALQIDNTIVWDT